MWQTLTATEQGGDAQSAGLPTLNCGPRSVTLVESDGSTDVDEAQPTIVDTYTLVLDSSPNPGETVTIDPSSDTVLGVTTSPAEVQFDDSNWSQPQTVDVAAVDDDQIEPLVHTDTITHALSSSGGVFDDKIPVDDVIVSIVENDFPQATLRILIEYPGFGLVESLPAGISCPGICSADFDDGSTVELSASTINDGRFFGWGTACSGQGACSVELNGETTVTATFGVPLSIWVNGFE